MNCFATIDAEQTAHLSFELCVFVGWHHDSYFDSVLPAIHMGAGAVANSDVLAPFSAIIGILNKDRLEDERSLASVFVFVYVVRQRHRQLRRQTRLTRVRRLT
jgi:hypothetical protein